MENPDNVRGSMRDALLTKEEESETPKDQEDQRIIRREEPEDRQDKILYRKRVEEEAVPVSRFCATLETRRFIYVNPAIYSQFSGLSLFAFLDQFLRLWPTIRRSALPYISIPAVAAEGVGFGIGVHSVYHFHDEQTNPYKRIWFAVLEGSGVIFPYLLGEVIEVYCSYPRHLDAEKNCMVSEKTFWDTFFPAPAVLGLGYMIWKMIPLLQKLSWMSHGKCKKFLVITIDSLADVLFYSRIFQTLMTNVSKIPQPLTYEWCAIPAGAIVLGGQILMPRHKEKIRIPLAILMTINLMIYMGNFLKQEFMSAQEAEEDPYSWSFLLKSIGFPLFFVAGTAFTIWRSKQSVFELRKKEEWVPVGEPQWLLDQYFHEAIQQRSERREELLEAVLKDEQLTRRFLEDRRVKELLLQKKSELQGSLQVDERELSEVDLGPPSSITSGSSPGDERWPDLQDDRENQQIQAQTEVLVPSEEMTTGTLTSTPTPTPVSTTTSRAEPPILHQFKRQRRRSSMDIDSNNKTDPSPATPSTPPKDTPKKRKNYCIIC